VSNAPSKPVSFSRPKVGYFSNRPRMFLQMYDKNKETKTIKNEAYLRLRVHIKKIT